jgi:hypothetical protein
VARSIQPLLEELLATVVAGFATADVALPSLQYVAPAFSVAYDTEQVTTNLLRIFPGRPGAETGFEYPMEQVFTAEIQATIVRRAAVVGAAGNAPNAAALGADATTFCTDIDTLTATLLNAVNSKALAAPGVPVVFLGVTPYGPQGGLMASLGKLQVQLV